MFALFLKLCLTCDIGVFSEVMIWENSEPMLFWLDVSDDVPELANFARMVLSARPHVAGCECVWSLSVAMFTKSCSRLNPNNFADMIQVLHAFFYYKMQSVNVSISTNHVQLSRSSTTIEMKTRTSKKKPC